MATATQQLAQLFQRGVRKLGNQFRQFQEVVEIQFRFRAAAVRARSEVSSSLSELEQLVNVTFGYPKQRGDFFDRVVLLIDRVNYTLAEF